jgi:hypothetical protein
MSRPSGGIRSSLALGAAALSIMCACTTFHTRYFQRIDTSEVRIGRFRLLPRLFAFEDEKSGSARVAKGVFTVTVRVEDTESAIEEYEWQAGQAVIDSLAETFLRDVTDEFVADSLKLHPIPDLGPSLKLIPDTTTCSPRRENFLTLRFGETAIPSSAEGLRVVLHVTHPGLPPTPDSVVFMMARVESEERGLMMFQDKVRGY